MITTTTSTVPNAEITEIISVVHNRIVLGTNLFSDIGAGFSDIFGGKNTAYEKRLAEITSQVIEGLKEKAKKQRADALIDLKIDVDEISGNGKSMFMVSAIATAVKLNKQIDINASISLDEVSEKITKHKILKSIEIGSFNPHENWVEPFILNNELPEAFDTYLRWISISSKQVENWNDLYSVYISNLNKDSLFDKTISAFSKENRNEYEGTALSTIFKYIVVDYSKILQIFTGDDIEKKRLCLNILFYYNQSYSEADFELVEKVLSKVIEVFPKTSTEEIGTGLLSKGSKYWRCQCGAKNESQYYSYCEKCSKDQYGNPNQTRKVNEVITKLEELLLVKNKK